MPISGELEKAMTDYGNASALQRPREIIDARAALVAAIEREVAREVEVATIVKMGMSALERADWAGVLRCFLEDPQFQVAVGGNPIAVEAMLVRARAVLEHYCPRKL